MKRLFAAFAIAATASGAAWAENCAAPLEIAAPLTGPVKPLERVGDYAKIQQSCTKGKASVIAIRRMRVDGEDALLTVDPDSLQTRLERAACWTCGDLTPEARNSRYLRAVEENALKNPGRAGANYFENAGLTHGRGDGAFVTGDLCPSLKPLDRDFVLNAEKQNFPVALSIAGLWISQHKDDFLWLRQEKAAGRLQVLWTNHSFHHPFQPGAPFGETFLLKPGLEPDAEIVNVERLLIANGETPSVFFRYPGLISNGEWAKRLRAYGLIALGADAWLALGARPSPGAVILVHPNGNEPAGLKIFDRLSHSGRLPKPFRPLIDAP